MKKTNYIFFTLLLLSINAFGKKVKFSVDMSGQIVSALGIRVTGDFQTAAGFAGGDWSLVTVMTQEVQDTNIYSIVVDIPAFKKYEFKFVNGDQFYETEFVPIESRVGYNFNDNRWIYIDSLANDTTIIGAILFAGNAPKNKKLIRFYVDMQNETISTKGVHVYGDFQNWNSTGTILYNFDSSSVYEVICYVDSLSTYEYKFINGDSQGEEETVPVACSVNNNRGFTSINDSLLATVCYTSCVACPNTLVLSVFLFSMPRLYPNPSSAYSYLESETNIKSIKIYDLQGKQIKEEKDINSNKIRLEKGKLVPGFYFIISEDYAGAMQRIKWQLE
jgi:hypothetical protein